MESYSKDLAVCLSALREVAQLLVQEHQAYHCKYINSRRPDPRIYSVGNIVFARHAVWPDASKERVDKLSYPFTGPWHITASLKGVSYDLDHCSIPNRKMKKHSLDLSLYPLELVPFEPVDGPDNQYCQLHKPINANPYKEAGIKGSIPPMPFKATSQFLTTDQFHWPSLPELNDDLLPFHWLSEEECKQYFDGNSISSLPVLHVGPPPSAPTYNTPRIPFISSLTTAIIRSTDKLFFISNPTDSNEAREWRLVRDASRNLCHCINCVYKMGAFLSNFISVTLQTLGTTQLINAFGFNTIWMVSFSHHSLWWRLILFVRPLLRLTMLPAISYLHSKNGWTWHIMTLSFTAPLKPPLSMATKHEIVSHKQTGMSSNHIATCSTTHYRVLIFRLIQFMLTAERMYCFTIQPLPVN
jgi:hypothetical protein